MLSNTRAILIWGTALLLLEVALHINIAFTQAQALHYEQQSDSLPSREALFDRFYSERKLLVIYGASSTEAGEALRNAVERSSWRWRTNLSFLHADEATSENLRGGAVLLIGNAESNPLLDRISTEIPAQFFSDGFSFLGKKYEDEGDVLYLSYPNPHDTRYPLFIISGVDEAVIRTSFGRRMRSYDFQVSRGGQRLRIGRFAQDIARRWQYDPENDLDFEAEIRLVGTTPHFKFYTHNATLNPDVLADLIGERERSAERVKAFLPDPSEPGAPISYYLYSGVQDKAVITNDMDFAHVNFDHEAVHVVFEDKLRGDGLSRENLLLLRRELGQPAVRMLEDGLGVYLSEVWFGKPYNEWLSRIAHANQALPASLLLDNEAFDNASPLLRDPLAAGLIACMVDEWGKETLFANYTEWTPSPKELEIIESVWSDCLNEARKSYKPALRLSSRNASFQKGFNFAHEGYGIVDGYGSEAAQKALTYLSDMGSNAVSVIPYSFMRDHTQPMRLRFPNTPGDENDAAVAHAATVSHDLGFTTMLKPQIWIRGSWPGDVQMQSEADWDAFFNHYKHWIGHYALLGEIFEFDIFCIGTELSKATMGRENWWAKLAGDLRSIYGGRLVYAANWGEEFESLSFWDAFDYIGLNSYYPLSEEDNPSEAALHKGANAIVKRMEKAAKKHKKPILLTEIGFASTPSPWKAPYQENRNAPAHPEHQALCYRIMMEALADHDWLAGIYWWKWPSYLERGGMNQKGFTPNGKPAADIVAEWYRSR